VRKFIVIAILALIGSTAAAEAKVHQFKFGGRVVRFEVPKNCKKISCIQANVKEKSSKAGKSESVAATAVPAAAAPVAAAAVDSPKATTPAPSAAPAAPAAPASQATQADDRKPLARLSLPVTDEPKPVVRATEPAIRATEPAPRATEPVAAAEPVKPAEPSPLGVWATEKDEGKVRIVECGEALCGHTEGKPSEKILINMQPGQKNRWNGKIHDVRSGGTYMSHMSMKGANALRVEGCAFGGLFCGGQTWTRVE